MEEEFTFLYIFQFTHEFCTSLQILRAFVLLCHLLFESFNRHLFHTLIPISDLSSQSSN
jgi:hypothetical protein